MVLDSVMWYGKTDERKGHYEAGLGEEQFTFIRNDLKHVDKDQLIVLTMHIPLIDVQERFELYKLLAEFPHTVSFSAHWHMHRHWFLGAEDGWPGPNKHHHQTFVTTCGSWWRGAPDEVGIPHTMMRDGGPNGYLVATFDGADYTLRFKAARRPADYQMNVFAPSAVTVSESGQTEVVVNVFVGSERSTVQMRVGNGQWQTLVRDNRPDPFYAAIKASEETDDPPQGRKLPRMEDSTHVWVGKLPPDMTVGSHLIEVRTTDMYGQSYDGRRIIRVTPDATGR
jgi:hypothetical protein